MKKITILLAVCALVFISCNSYEDKAAPPPPAAEPTATDATPAATSDQPPAQN